MINKLMLQAKKSFYTVDSRTVVFVVMLVLFVLGAGAPGASGGSGGG